MPNSINLSGFKEFGDKLNRLPNQLSGEVDEVVGLAAAEWELRAEQDAPVDQGHLRGQITHKKNSQMNWEVVSPVEYSAYLEWGTRTRVNVPADLQAYASQFRSTGQSGAKKMIYAWMDRVGIPKDKQWFVFISIMVKGIHPHPFFFKQGPLVEQQLVRDITDILNTEH